MALGETWGAKNEIFRNAFHASSMQNRETSYIACVSAHKPAAISFQVRIPGKTLIQGFSIKKKHSSKPNQATKHITSAYKTN